MKKIKNVLKNNILSFAIGTILFSVLIVSAATLLNGREIQYTSNKVVAANIQEALDKLYDEARPVIPEQCTTPKYNFITALTS